MLFKSYRIETSVHDMSRVSIMSNVWNNDSVSILEKDEIFVLT